MACITFYLIFKTIKVAICLYELTTSSNVTENELTISDVELLQKRMADLAYYKAEKRGFCPGHEHEDWLEA
jgi:hypothetical protein